MSAETVPPIPREQTPPPSTSEKEKRWEISEAVVAILSKKTGRGDRRKMRKWTYFSH